MRFLKRTGQVILIPLIVGLIVFVLLAVSYLLPTEGMKAHVQNTLFTFEQEGLYPFVNDEQGSMRDNYIDALNLSQAIVGTQDTDLISCVVKNPFYSGSDTAAPVENLKAAIAAPESVTLANTEYRFFNGHLIIEKLLLTVMGYNGIRMLCFYACLLGTAWMGYLMYKRKLGRFIAPFMLSILFLRPYTVWSNMLFALIYMAMLIPCIVMLLIRKETLKERAWLLFGITGSVTFCLVQNYFQLMAFGMPLMMFFLIAGIPEKPGELLKNIVNLFTAWMIGYAGAMLFKWTVYTVATGENIFSEMIRHALWRANEEEGSRMATVARNAQIAFGSVWWDVIEIGFIGYMVFRRIRSRTRIRMTASGLLLLSVAILFAVGRLAILSNHSMIHAPFTYRVFMMPVLAFNLLLTKRIAGTESV